jgi:hypothetical protein
MPEAAARSNLGRCPACQQLVTVPAEGSSGELACPACQHRAPAASFATVELPRAAIVVPARAAARPLADPDRTHLLLDLAPDADADADDDDDDTPARGLAAAQPPSKPAQSAPARSAPPRRPSSSRHGAASDDERTHLLLEAADLREEHADNERTHLLLDAADLREEPPSPPARPAPRSQRQAAPDALSSDDERTHLQLGPLSVRPEPAAPLTRALAWASRIVPPALRLSVRLDEALHGRWLWVLGAIGVLCGGIAPGVDTIATRGHATLAGFTWLCCTLSLTLLGISRLNSLRDDAGLWDPRLALVRARSRFRLLVEGFEHFDASPRQLRLALIGQALTATGLCSLAWTATIAGLRWLVGLDAAASSLPVLSGLLLLAGVACAWQSERSSPRPGLFLQDFGNCLAAALELPAIVDLSEPLPEPFSRGVTALHECVLALAKWRPRSWPDERAYRFALGLHLQRQLPGAKIECERWMGASRLDGVLDLVVNGMIVIGVQRGFDVSSAERAIGQMSGYARAWSGKPMLLAVFDAPRDAMLDNPHAAPLIAAHEEFGLLTLRMPLN